MLAMNTEIVAFLGLGTNQLEYLLAAKNMGYFVIGFDGDGSAPCRNLCDESYSITIDKYEKIIGVLKHYKILVGCVSEQTDSGLLSVGAINSAFSLPGPTFDLVASVKNKFFQRRKCETLGVRQPDFCLYEIDRDFKGVAADLLGRHERFILKPCEGQSSIAVRAFSKQELMRCNKKELFADLRSKSGSERFLIEEYIVGEDISIEGFVYNSKTVILAVTSKTKYFENPFVDNVLRVHPYCALEHELESDLVRKIVTGYSLNNSFFHIEAKRHSGGLTLVEWTPRGCGARLSSVLLSKMYGEDMAALRVRMLKRDRGIPKLACLGNIGLLQFFNHRNIETNLLQRVIEKYTMRYALCLSNKAHNQLGESGAQIADGRSRTGSLIAVGTAKQIESLSIEMGTLVK